MEVSTVDHVTTADSLVPLCLGYNAPQVARTFVEKVFCKTTYLYTGYNARTHTETLSKTTLFTVICKLIEALKKKGVLEDGWGPLLCNAIHTWAEIDRKKQPEQAGISPGVSVLGIHTQLEQSANVICKAVAKFLGDELHTAMKIEGLLPNSPALERLQGIFGKSKNSDGAHMKIVPGDNGQKTAWVSTTTLYINRCCT